MAKHQIHYTSLEGVSKKSYGKQFATVTTHKDVQNYYNEKCTYNVIIHWNLLYALKIRTLFKRDDYFIFAKSSWHLLRSDVWKMLMLALRLFLKDKGGGKQHCLIPFVG